MKIMTARATVLLVRLFGSIALGSGLIAWAYRPLPVFIHIASGSILVIALWILAWRARHIACGLALLATATGAIIPLAGLAQWFVSLGQFRGASQWFHLAAGFAGISLAEMMAKRLRLSGRR